ncbi:MAG: NAD-dependent epimerase/dehydratase family protein [Deltaproteobacteria bacterium]|nr:NAD-dependent epimerase/dehydratase family protein [Deltaproteobacteria bacterium]
MIPKPNTALVTGGGGFLGMAIIRRLVEKGVRVRSLARNRYAELDRLEVEQIQADLRDAQSVQRACQSMDRVFHVAAKAGVWGRKSDFVGINIAGTQHVIDACKLANVSRLIYTSSPAVVFDGADMNGVDETAPYPARYHAHYPATKAAAEKRVIAATGPDLSTLILRPHLIWGPGDNHLVPRILKRAKQLRRIGNGQNRVDTVYIDNAADAHVLADERLKAEPGLSGRRYFISQGEPVLLWDMVDAILKAGGLGPVRGRIHPRAAWCAGALLEGVYRLLRLPGEPRMTRFLARELSTNHWFDIRAAKQDLGYTPAVTTEQGLERLATWLQEKNT